MKLPELKELPEDAKGEMPAATDKIKSTKGSFVWWVFNLLLFVSAGSSYLLYLNKAKEADYYKEQYNNTLNKLINKLENVEYKVGSVVERSDTITEQVIDNKQKIELTLQKLSNVAK